MQDLVSLIEGLVYRVQPCHQRPPVVEGHILLAAEGFCTALCLYIISYTVYQGEDLFRKTNMLTGNQVYQTDFVMCMGGGSQIHACIRTCYFLKHVKLRAFVPCGRRTACSNTREGGRVHVLCALLISLPHMPWLCYQFSFSMSWQKHGRNASFFYLALKYLFMDRHRNARFPF